jgi:hypothetical protein
MGAVNRPTTPKKGEVTDEDQDFAGHLLSWQDTAGEAGCCDEGEVRRVVELVGVSLRGHAAQGSLHSHLARLGIVGGGGNATLYHPHDEWELVGDMDEDDLLDDVPPAAAYVVRCRRCGAERHILATEPVGNIAP